MLSRYRKQAKYGTDRLTYEERRKKNPTEDMCPLEAVATMDENLLGCVCLDIGKTIL